MPEISLGPPASGSGVEMEIQVAAAGPPPQPETAGAPRPIELQRRPPEKIGLTYSLREVIKPRTGHPG